MEAFNQLELLAASASEIHAAGERSKVGHDSPLLGVCSCSYISS